MRIQSPVLVGVSDVTPAAVAGRQSRPVRLDPVEWALLIGFALMSMWVIGLDLYNAIAHDRVWTGTDGFFIVDQMQYLAWIQSAPTTCWSPTCSCCATRRPTTSSRRS